LTAFVDNLQVHKTKRVRDLCAEAGINLIFNVPYSPEFNGIESYWSLVKSKYKRKLHLKMMKNEWLDTRALVIESLKEVDPEKVKSCALDGEKRIMS